MFNLATCGAAQADYPSHFAMVYKRHVVQNFSSRGERNHSYLAVLEPVIDPHQRGFPVEFIRQGQRDAVLRLVCLVLARIKLDSRALL